MKINKGDFVWFVDWEIIEPRGVRSGIIVHNCDVYQLCYILPLGEVEPLHVEWEWVCGQEEEALELFREYSLGGGYRMRKIHSHAGICGGGEPSQKNPLEKSILAALS